MMKRLDFRNLKWAISATAYVALMAVANAKGMIMAAIYVLAAVIASMYMPDMHRYYRRNDKKHDIFAALLAVVGGLNFYTMWQPSSMMEGIAQKIGLTRSTFLAIAAVIGMVAAFYSLRCCVGALAEVRKRNAEQKPVSLHEQGHRVGKKEYVFLLLAAAIVITICSKSSPLYPFNDWVDSNCFFTVGKSMLHGKVLYRDIYEQKGFYLYVLHTLAYMISNTSFFGVYLLEIIAAFAFLVFAYRIALLYCADQDVLYAAPAIAAVVYGAQAFCHGDSAEEFCLPLLAYALWVGLKAMRKGGAPEKREYVLIGITSGVVLWIKYTMLGFYLGWYAILGYGMLKQRSWKKMLDSLKWIALGVFCACIPVLIYFGVNQAINDLWRVYFFDNMYVYSDSAEVVQNYGILGNVINGARLAVFRDGLLSGLIALAVLWHWIVGNRADTSLLLGCMVGSLLVFVGDISPVYYAFAFGVFAAAALPGVYTLCRMSKLSMSIFGVGGALISLVLSNNTYMLKYEKQDLPQFAFKEIIEQVPQATLLNYGFLDGGFYTVCDIVPHCKFFCQTNMNLEEMKRTQREYVENGWSDFIVTRSKVIESDLYECVAEQDFFFEYDFTYRLYALKELNLQ